MGRTVNAKASALVTAGKVAVSARTRRAEDLLLLINRRKEQILDDFYDIGMALREILEKKLFEALGYASFDELLTRRRVMGRTQAWKLIKVVRELPRERAMQVGQERAFALVTLADATPEPDTAASLLTTGVKVGGRKRDVAKLSKREIEALAKSARPHRTTEEQRAAAKTARAAQRALRARHVRATVVARREADEWWAIITVPMAQLRDIVRER
jgi:hypothetical protein